MKHILVISFSNLATDPRVNRQIRWLMKDYRVTAAGLADPELPGVDFVPLEREAKGPVRKAVGVGRLLTGQYERYYWDDPRIERYLDVLTRVGADLVIANDIETLPLALRLGKGARVLFDAHEYAPGQFDDRFLFRILRKGYRVYLCRTYIPRVDAMVTVSQGICDAYERDTGVCPELITNAPDYCELSPQPLTNGKIRLVHHGAAIESRGIENMIRMMDHVDERFELSLILAPTSRSYLERLRQMAAERSNVFFLPPVPMRTLPDYLNRFDVGVYLLEPRNFNSMYALPNKLFEFVQARLAVAIGPSPEMAAVVRQHGLGRVSRDFAPASLAEELNRLDRDELEKYKQKSAEAAQTLSARSNAERFRTLVHDVVGQ